MGGELGQLNENQVKSLNHTVGVLHMHHAVVVIELLQLRLIDVVD